jgi:uncharacterized Zn-finger protein
MKNHDAEDEEEKEGPDPTQGALNLLFSKEGERKFTKVDCLPTPLGFKCTRCDKIFTERYNLKVHMYTHIGQRPHKCGICGRAFSNIANKNDHIRRHFKAK